MTIRFWACLLAPWIVAPTAPLAVAMTDRPEREYDCGTSALCVLLRLEGHPISLAELPAPPVEGRGQSMKDLKEVAARHGLALSGLKIDPAPGAIDRPSLLFVDRKPHGHYLVVRPVGPSGRLVQVIDPGREPFVVDAIDLFQSPGWTGVALVPGRSGSWRRALGIAAGVALLGWSAIRIVRRSPRPGREPSPGGSDSIG